MLQNYVRSYAHCEYQNGFLIFDRLNSSKEVWRHYPEYDEGAASRVSQKPDDAQLKAGLQSMSEIARDDKRGCFKPWALLRVPEIGRAYRFVFPTLLVVSWSKAYLYNAVEGKLTQTIEIAPDDEEDVSVHYVEVNEEYVFVCFTKNLRIYARLNGEQVFSIPAIPTPSIRSFVAKESKYRSDGRRRRKHTVAVLDIHHEPEFKPPILQDIHFIAGVHLSYFRNSRAQRLISCSPFLWT